MVSSGNEGGRLGVVHQRGTRLGKVCQTEWELGNKWRREWGLGTRMAAAGGAMQSWQREGDGSSSGGGW
ncbi:hypothetical protein CsSME_00023221 [Camellia sinensis var. sinensis]